jgi:hypothetical protein
MLRMIGRAWRRWTVPQMTDAERKVSESLKALHTLTYKEGRVSIDPQEVLNQPGYLEARIYAGSIVRKKHRGLAAPGATWSALDDLGVMLFSEMVASQLIADRQAGVSLDEAISKLKVWLAEDISK